MEDLRLSNFSSPLDLLDYLLAQKDLDITAMSLSEIAAHYLEIMRSWQDLDMEIASEFILMAATLIQLKTRLLLPSQVFVAEEDDEYSDLVMKLIIYRRNKVLAKELASRHGAYQVERPALSSKSLGISQEYLDDPVQAVKFKLYASLLAERNQQRFNEQTQRINQLLRRERFSVSQKIKDVLAYLQKIKRVYFHEVFSLQTKSKAEVVAGFLAILELVKRNKIIAKQSRPFQAIRLAGQPKKVK